MYILCHASCTYCSYIWFLQETVAALISTKPEGVSEGDIDGVPLMDDQPIDFSKGVSIDGVPMVGCMTRTRLVPKL